MLFSRDEIYSLSVSKLINITIYLMIMSIIAYLSNFVQISIVIVQAYLTNTNSISVIGSNGSIVVCNSMYYCLPKYTWTLFDIWNALQFF